MSETELLFRNGKHKFTPDETHRGQRASARMRKGLMRDIKKITGMELDAETLQQAIKLLTVWAATPVGQVILGFVLANGLQKIGIINGADRDHITGVILTEAVLSSLGSSNLIPQIGSLTAALKGAG